MRHTAPLILLVPALLATPAADAPSDPPAAGPFQVDLPVPGLRPEHQEKVVAALTRILGGRGVLEPICTRDRLQFFYGQARTGLLRLSTLSTALQKTGLRLTPEDWILHPQEIGLTLSSREGGTSDATLQKLLAGMPDAGVTLLGIALDDDRFCAVVDVHAPVRYRKLQDTLQEAGIRIEDLAWGHWKYGWDLAGKGGHRHHQVRATLAPAPEKDGE